MGWMSKHLSLVTTKFDCPVSDQVRHKPGSTDIEEAGGLKFRISKVKGMFCLCSENKGVDQLRGTAQLICVFVFGYGKYTGFLMTRLICGFVTQNVDVNYENSQV